MSALGDMVRQYEILIEDQKAAIEDLLEERKELISLNLWSARRLKNDWYKNFAYDELETITGEKHERL